MVSGMKNQLTKQIGEYLVASELARKGYLSATFSGNVPYFDIIATNISGKSIPVQVKTINGGSWQFSIDKFINIHMEGKKQIFDNIIEQPIKDLICIFVLLGNKYGEDKFYLIKWDKVQNILIENHKKYIEAHNGERPKVKDSMHCGLKHESLTEYENNWDIFNI